jgi:transcription termination/antitermination protein NusG
MLSPAEGWLVIWTESRAEKKVASRLSAKGIEAWLPSVTERHRWSDRWRDVVMPLFPGYLFARGDSNGIAQVLQTPGVLTLVKHEGRPVLLEHDFIARLRRAVESGGPDTQRVTQQPPRYCVGDEVVVQEGPLAGARGVVRENRGARRLLIWIREIGHGVAFTIGCARVRRDVPAQ